jgi:hypothetical protein
MIFREIPFELNFDFLKEKLHIKAQSGYEDCLENIIHDAEKTANPKAVYRESYINSRDVDSVVIDGIKFTSRTLRTNLDRLQRVFPYVATCGIEIDSIKINHDDLLEVYILDTIKEILLGYSMDYLEHYICSRYDFTKTSSMNPGSSEIFVWPIEQQKELFSLFPDIHEEIGVELTESCLMIPNKSISGIKFPTDTDFHNCKVCEREKCQSRTEPFDEKLFKSAIDSINN